MMEDLTKAKMIKEKALKYSLQTWSKQAGLDPVVIAQSDNIY